MSKFAMLPLILVILAQTLTAQTRSTLSDAEIKAALDVHNRARAAVGVPPLELSAELSRYAQVWADYLAQRKLFQHRPRTGTYAQRHGENLYKGWGKAYTAAEASTAWYDEIKLYTYGPISSKNSAKTGHYTQMVWRSTTKVGFGKAIGKDGSTVIVANYDPAGNYLGQKPY